MSLTDLEAKRAKTKEKPYKLGDACGLFLWVTPSGGKLWRWSYRHEGKQKLMTLGKYPDVSLASARDRHSASRRTLASGVDPMAQRKAEKTAEQVASESSFANIAARWMEHWQHGKRFSPGGLDSAPFSRQYPPQSWCASDCGDRGTRIGRNGQDYRNARRARHRQARVRNDRPDLRYGIAHGYAKRNPASEIRPSDVLKTTRKVNYARIDTKDLPNLLRQIEVYPGTHVTRLAIKLMALTFVRTSELIGAKWSEFDLKAARWNIPEQRMKMRTPHTVPLATQAMEILGTLRELTGNSEWLFPGDRNPKHPMSNNTILKGLERMGYKGRMTGHGFRGIAPTILHEQGFSHEHIELQLAHAPRNA